MILDSRTLMILDSQTLMILDSQTLMILDSQFKWFSTANLNDSRQPVLMILDSQN